MDSGVVYRGKISRGKFVFFFAKFPHFLTPLGKISKSLIFFSPLKTECFEEIEFSKRALVNSK
jgi:hypothetical protein